MGAEVACGTSSAVATGVGGAAGDPDTPGARSALQRPSSSSGSAASSLAPPAAGASGAVGQRSLRAGKFHRLLSMSSVDLGALRELLWSGAPEDDPGLRAEAWQMLLGYLPPVRDRQAQGVAKKRGEYEELKKRHYRFVQELEDGVPGTDSAGGGGASSSAASADGAPGGGMSAALSASAAAAAAEADGDDAAQVLRQIRVDIPRTSQGGLPLFGHPRMQRLMERVLYIWSVRHPASGYVQGINDLLTPFIVVLLASEVRSPIEEIDVGAVAEDVMQTVEAGSYWCLTKVLSDIQDHYTAGQPGIQAMILKLKDIVRRIDEKLFRHLEDQGIDFMQFAFRWMNCLLMREFPLQCIIRLWDTYIAEPSEGFSTFHVYVCAVFLIYWSPQLKKMDFQQFMLFMRKLPTATWRRKEIETLLAEAYVLKSLFHSSPKHLAAPTEGL